MRFGVTISKKTCFKIVQAEADQNAQAKVAAMNFLVT
jgi:hypothetical protein